MDLPQFKLLIWDETEHWAPDIVEKSGGKIRGIYLFDATYRIHICDTSPSFELCHVESMPEAYPESDEERENLLDDLEEGNSQCDAWTYTYCRNVNLDDCGTVWDVTEKEWQELLDYNDGDEEKARQEAFEQCLEYLRANGAEIAIETGG